MRVLALDISRHVGAAHDGPVLGRPIMVTKHLPTIEGTGENGFDFGPAFAAYWIWLGEIIAVVDPEMIAFEAPLMPRGGNFYTPEVTVRLLMTLAGLTETMAQLKRIDCDERNNASMKKHFAGHGHADKAAMMARCQQLGWAPNNNNEADAAGLWALIKAEYEPGFGISTTPMYGRRA